MKLLLLLLVAASVGCQSGTPTKEQEAKAAAEAAGPVTDDSCAALPACKNEGDCVAINGKCGPKDGNACLTAPGCGHRGLCVPGPANDPKCRAGSAADCERSEGCRRFQRCVYVNGTCQPR